MGKAASFTTRRDNVETNRCNSGIPSWRHTMGDKVEGATGRAAVSSIRADQQVRLRFLFMARHTGIASLPLHTGKAPPWLFSRMTRLSREIVVCGAVREGLRNIDVDLGFFAAGGKGGTSRLTPGQIADICERTGGPASRATHHAPRTAPTLPAAQSPGPHALLSAPVDTRRAVRQHPTPLRFPHTSRDLTASPQKAMSASRA